MPRRRQPGRSTHDLPPRLHRILDDQPGLHIDLSWSAMDEFDRADDEVDEQWVELIEAHPDRFVTGSDVFGRFEDLHRAPTRLAPSFSG